MNKKTLLPCLAISGVLSPVPDAGNTLHSPPPAAIAPQNVREEIKAYRHLIEEYFTLIATIHDTASADKAVPALKSVGVRLNRFHKEYPYEQLPRIERQFINQTYLALQEIESNRKTPIRISSQDFYHSDALFETLTRELPPVSPAFEDTHYLPTSARDRIRRQNQNEVDQDTYVFAKMLMKAEAEQRHIRLLTQPGSPYRGGMGWTEEDAVILQGNHGKNRQELQDAYLETVYQTTRPFVRRNRTSPDGDIVTITLDAEIERHTGKRPDRPTRFDIHFRFDTPVGGTPEKAEKSRGTDSSSARHGKRRTPTDTLPAFRASHRAV